MKKALFSLLCLLTLSLAANAETAVFYADGASNYPKTATNTVKFEGTVADKTYTAGNLSLSFQKVNNTASTVNGGQIRFYANDKINIAGIENSDILITKIVVACVSSYAKMTITTPANQTFTTSSNVMTWNGSADKVTLSNSAQARFTYIEVTYDDNSAPTITLLDPNLRFGTQTNGDIVKIKSGEDFVSPTILYDGNGTVSCTSSNHEVAVVDNNGAVNVIGIGATVITATITETETHKAAKVSYTLVVTDPNAISETVDFTTKGYGNASEVGTVKENLVTVAIDKGTNSQQPYYYTTGTAVRVYGNNTVTISVPANYYITSFELTTDSSYSTLLSDSKVTANGKTVGLLSENNWFALGEQENTIMLTNGTTNSGHTRIQTIKVFVAKKAGAPDDTPVVIELEDENFVVTLNGEPIEFEDDIAEIEADANSVIDWTYKTDVENADLNYWFIDMDDIAAEPVEKNSYTFTGESVANFGVSVMSGEDNLIRYLAISKKLPTECPKPYFSEKNNAEVYAGKKITAYVNEPAEGLELYVNEEKLSETSYIVAGEIGDVIVLKAVAFVTGKEGPITNENTITVKVVEQKEVSFDFTADKYGMTTTKDSNTYEETTKSINNGIVTISFGDDIKYRHWEATDHTELRVNKNQANAFTIAVPETYYITKISFGGTSSGITGNGSALSSLAWTPANAEEETSSVVFSVGGTRADIKSITVYYEKKLDKLAVADHESGKISYVDAEDTETTFEFVIEGIHEAPVTAENGVIDINAHKDFKRATLHKVTPYVNGVAGKHIWVLTQPQAICTPTDAEETSFKITFQRGEGVTIHYKHDKSNAPLGKATRSDEGYTEWDGEDFDGNSTDKLSYYATATDPDNADVELRSATKENDTVTGVLEVLGEEFAEAKVYDLNGREVKGELTPGVYVVVKGAKSAKVVIR